MLPDNSHPADSTGWVAPPRAFVWLALLFGIPLALITAPFQAPDEPQHLLRAYQISEGGFLPDRRGERGGGELPVSLAEVPRPFANIRFHLKEKTSWQQIRSMMRLPLDPNRREFIPFVTAIYSPVGYFPQAAAMAIGRTLSLPPLGLMYLARVFNLLAWIGLGYLALRITPVCGRALLLLLLMPMSLFQAASMSPDATTNGLAVLFAAMIVRLVVTPDGQRGACGYFVARVSNPCESAASALIGAHPTKPSIDTGLSTPNTRSASTQLAHGLQSRATKNACYKRPIQPWYWAVLTLISAALTLTKFAYLPLAAWVLLIPAARFANARAHMLSVVLLLAANVAVILLWAPQTRGLNAVVNDKPHVSPHLQLAFLESHPSAVVTVTLRTIATDGWSMVRSCVGWLGSMEIRMNAGFIVAYLAALFAACWSDKTPNGPIRVRRWLVVILIPAVLAIGAVGLLNYIFWTRVGLGHVEGLQGRYLLPLAPAIVYLVWALTRKLPAFPWNHLPERTLNRIACGVSIFSSSYAIILVFLRYYVR